MYHTIQPIILQQICPELRLVKYNAIPAISLQHDISNAVIALQGAQLLSWQPKGSAHDVLWLSEIEPFQLGKAIRGGIPLCYPWFGPVKTPSHGTARIRLWHLIDYAISTDKVRLVFGLFTEDHLIEAKVSMDFAQDCQVRLTHYGQENAQVALHSYFHVGDIEQIEIQGLPTHCVSNLTKQHENVPSPRQIQQNVDCTYHITNAKTSIVDPVLQREISLEHQQASEVVLWNPWHKETSGMSEFGYQTMVCVETARITQQLKQGEEIAVRITLK
ncbi:TPA: D-hexose-6-phosphate mutarotase [Pasteurella multocida]|nr:D-hexose-6-phosphate mutarotase [Pasteurella multocida]HED4399451.1 D-hexose-6-phosphate mutarotase [Pasteurella multocida]